MFALFNSAGENTLDRPNTARLTLFALPRAFRAIISMSEPSMGPLTGAGNVLVAFVDFHDPTQIDHRRAVFFFEGQFKGFKGTKSILQVFILILSSRSLSVLEEKVADWPCSRVCASSSWAAGYLSRTRKDAKRVLKILNVNCF